MLSGFSISVTITVTVLSLEMDVLQHRASSSVKMSTLNVSYATITVLCEYLYRESN